MVVLVERINAGQNRSMLSTVQPHQSSSFNNQFNLYRRQTMASKYDTFWESQISIVSDLISQAASWGCSNEVDVSGLVEYGKRESWYGIVDVSGSGFDLGEMVHAGSLGRMVCHNGLLEPYPGMRFRFTITQVLKLSVKNITAKEQPIDSPVTDATFVQPCFIGPDATQPSQAEASLQLSDVLATLPMDAWNVIVAKEPEWQHMSGFLPQFGFGPFAVLMTVAGLNNNQLKQRAETGYWLEIRQILAELPPPGSCQDLYDCLAPFYRREQLENKKNSRLETFLGSRLADKLWHGTAQAVAQNYEAIWRELAQTMNQNPEDKTICFAMKYLGLSLIMAGETKFAASELPIPVDSRMIFFAERLRLCADNTPATIWQVWKTVLDQLRQKMPDMTMIHLDSLIWQIALLNSEEIVCYFAHLRQETVGKELAHFVLYGSGKKIPEPVSELKPKPEPEGSEAEPEPEVKVLSPKAVTLITQYEGRIACFIPCCSSKNPTGQIIQPVSRVSEQDLPDTWSWLVEGRKRLSGSIETTTQPTSALYLYTGALYQAFAPPKSQVIDLIGSGRLSLYIMSAEYGIVSAGEPIQSYDVMLKGDTAVLWRKQHLDQILAELLIRSRPTQIYGFFAGSATWYPAASSYRYFFTEGVRSALRQGLTAQAGCFYRKSGLGVRAILSGIGKAFSGLLESDFDPAYADTIEQHGLSVSSVQIGFARIKT
jgi:N-glycosylase/DNA lyase